MTGDRGICGYGLRDGSYCKTTPEDDEHRCPVHLGLLCASCEKYEALYECPHDGTPLCAQCQHIAPTVHGPRPDPQDVVREELSRALEMCLERLNESERLPSTGPQRRDSAPVLLQDLLNHIALKVLSGLAQPERGE